FQVGGCRLWTAAGGDCPRYIGRGQCRKKLARPWEGLNLAIEPVERLTLSFLDSLDAIRIDVATDLSQKLLREEITAHADLAVDSGDGEAQPFAIQRFAPCDHVLVDAIDERAVEVKNEG
ncbi:MAG: hypothetical protein JWR14_523, partial [Caballeronia sp.]|nr:hypothetical protein [Caballeronia sp.]